MKKIILLIISMMLMVSCDTVQPDFVVTSSYPEPTIVYRYYDSYYYRPIYHRPPRIIYYRPAPPPQRPHFRPGNQMFGHGSFGNGGR